MLPLHPTLSSQPYLYSTSQSLSLATSNKVAYEVILRHRVSCCRHGVNRSHVIHARVPGALLLELYSRDGLGTMVSADFYEGAAMTEVQFMNNTRASL